MGALLERLFRHRGAGEFLRVHGWEDAFRPLLEWSKYDVEWVQLYGVDVVHALADRRGMEVGEVAQRLIDPSEKALQREAEALLRKAGATVSVGTEAVERVTRRGTLRSLVEAVEGWINVDRGNAWEGWLNRWVHTDRSMGVNPRLRVQLPFPSGEADRISDRVLSLTKVTGNEYRAVVSDAKLLHEASVLPADQMLDWQFLIKKAAAGGFPSTHPVTGSPIVITGLEFLYIHHSQQRAALSLAQATKLTSSVATQNMRFAYVVETGSSVVKTLANVP
jgi:hypothetical protein